MRVIILDLDHTLVHSVKILDDDNFDKDESCGSNGVQLNTGYVCFKRPNVDVFLRWCFRKFDRVLIWSAGTNNYVNEIIDVMFGEFSFDLVLGRNECDYGYYKDFTSKIVRDKFRKKSIHIKRSDVYFVDDKMHRVQNSKGVTLMAIEPFETKWKDVIQSSKKRKRPIREKDNYLLEVRDKISVSI